MRRKKTYISLFFLSLLLVTVYWMRSQGNALDLSYWIGDNPEAGMIASVGLSTILMVHILAQLRRR